MNESMDIKSFIEHLIDKTKNEECIWESPGNEKYRLLLKSGSVLLQRIIDSIYTTYKLDLSDSEGCFATYKANTSLDHFYTELEKLYEAVIEYLNKQTEKKIAILFKDL